MRKRNPTQTSVTYGPSNPARANGEVAVSIKSTTEGLSVNARGGIIVEDNGSTTKEGVFAGGDAVTGAATVISAMGAGKIAAKAIDEYLSKK